MAIPIQAGGDSAQLMQMLLLLDQMDEKREEREIDREERRSAREFEKAKMEEARIAQKRQEMLSFYEGLRGATNKEGAPKYTDKQIDELMNKWYPGEWKGLGIGGDVEKKAVEAAVKGRSLMQDVKQEGVLGGLKKAGRQQLEDLAQGAATLFGGEQMGTDVRRGLNVLGTERQDPSLIPQNALSSSDPIRAGLSMQDEAVQQGQSMPEFGQPTPEAPYGSIGGIPIADERALASVLSKLGI